MASVKVVFTGSPSYASVLAACIEAEGGTVSWGQPYETRDGADAALQDVVVALIVTGVASSSRAAARTAARAGLAKFHETHPGQGSAVILDGGQDDRLD
jgi:hypothetical protein